MDGFRRVEMGGRTDRSPHATQRWAARAGVAAGLTVVGIGLSVFETGCGPTFDVQQSFVRTGTVTLGEQTALVIDTAVFVDLQANRRTNEITWKLDGTASATSAGAAKNLAESIDIAVDTSGDAVRLTVSPVQDGLLEGTWQISAPADLDVQMIGRGPGQQIVGFDGNIGVDAAGGVIVLQSRGDIAIRSNTGDILIDTSLPPGRTVDVSAGGSIQVALPFGLNAAISARVTDGFAIDVRHRDYPSWPGGNLPYLYAPAGASSQVLLDTRLGNIFITPPL